MTSLVIHDGRKIDADGAQGDFWLRAEEGTIVETGTGAGWRRTPADRLVDASGLLLTPGFIDLHAHGGGGHTFDDSVDDIRAALAVHRRHGTTRSVLSLVANPLARLRGSLDTIATLSEADPLILGSHLEGPFLAVNRRGAHNADFLRPPHRDDARTLLAAARGTLRQVTLAPELPGALALIDDFASAGVTVAVGHTEATESQARAAFDAGARLLTHAFNAMPGIHHREPGPLMAAIGDPRIAIELILDGLHVHPHVARLLFGSVGDRVALVTDAMAAAGSRDGNYRLGTLNVTVVDGLAVLSGTDTIAGSTLTLDRALRVAIGGVGLDPVRAVTALTLTPATALGLDCRLGRLRPGYAADAVLLDPDWEIRQVWAQGTLLTDTHTHEGDYSE